jgi:hypothetical protein
MYIMDCFRPKEIKALALALDLKSENLLSHVKKWGPSVRLALAFERGNLTEGALTARVKSACCNFSSNPRLLFQEFSSISYTIFAVRPKLDNRRVVELYIPTPYIWRCISVAVAKADPRSQREFFVQLRSHPPIKGPGGWLNKKFVHTRLTADLDPAYYPDSIVPPLMARPCKEETSRSTISLPVLHNVETLSVASVRGVEAINVPFTHQIRSLGSIV